MPDPGRHHSKKRRKVFLRFLEHEDPRVRELTREMQKHDEETRAGLRRLWEEEEPAEVEWLTALEMVEGPFPEIPELYENSPNSEQPDDEIPF